MPSIETASFHFFPSRQKKSPCKAAFSFLRLGLVQVVVLVSTEMTPSSFIAFPASSGFFAILNLFGNTLVCVLILQNQNMRTPLDVAASVNAFLVFINSSINWVLYASFSKQFRNCFRRALCSCSRTQEPSGGHPRVNEIQTPNGVQDTRL